MPGVQDFFHQQLGRTKKGIGRRPCRFLFRPGATFGTVVLVSWSEKKGWKLWTNDLGSFYVFFFLNMMNFKPQNVKFFFLKHISFHTKFVVICQVNISVGWISRIWRIVVFKRLANFIVLFFGASQPFWRMVFFEWRQQAEQVAMSQLGETCVTVEDPADGWWV